MQHKTFVAPDTQTALRQIKEELGPDAVIISSRKLRARRGAFGLLSAGGVEITAGLEPVVAALPKPAPGSIGGRMAARTYAVVGGEDGERDAVREAVKSSPGDDAKEAEKDDSILLYVKPLREEIRALSQAVAQIREGSRRSAKPSSDSREEVGRLCSQISELRFLIGKVAEDRESASLRALPEPLRVHTMRLADAGLDLDIIRKGLERLGRILTPDQLEDEGYVSQCVRAELMKHITCAPPMERADGRAQVIALVGPTGVGKTTTAAKLAGQMLRTNPRAQIALLTLDTFRIGAYDQLHTYGEMMRMSTQVAHTCAELDQMIRRRIDHDLIIIDTAGGSQKDERLLDELAAFLTPNPLIETHLCLSSTTKARDLRDICDRFMPLAIEKLIFTKVDETNCGGTLYNLLTQSGRPLAYMTHGQNVPDDMMVASKEQFCRWVMGE